jgi:hypothetical protein
MKKLRRFYSSIFLLFIGGVIVYNLIPDYGCSGMPDALLIVFLLAVYLITILVILIRELLNTGKRFNFYPIITTVIVAFAMYLAMDAEKFESPTILYAQTQNDHASLRLRENGKFVATEMEIEWGCSYTGEYQIKNDTLRLLRDDIQAITHDAISNIYLIDNEKRLLYPIDKYTRDTMFWLAIEYDRTRQD